MTIPFSIVIPLYNKEKTIGRALRSVVNQTEQSFEVIVVNDGSTDNSTFVVSSFNDHRFRLINQENRGVSEARNRGIVEARHDLIAFLDADDVWLPTFLETVLNLYHKYNSCGVFATNYFFQNPNGKYQQTVIRNLPKQPWEGILTDYFSVAAISDPPLWSSAIAVKKQVISSVGMFPAGVTLGEDLLTWARLAGTCPIAYTTTPHSVYILRKKLGTPVGVPDKIDFVGEELKLLLNKQSDTIPLKRYIALWHKMRTSQYLQNGLNREARKEIYTMRRFKPGGMLFYIFLFISLFPSGFSVRLYAAFCLLKIVRRRCAAIFR